MAKKKKNESSKQRLARNDAAYVMLHSNLAVNQAESALRGRQHPARQHQEKRRVQSRKEVTAKGRKNARRTEPSDADIRLRAYFIAERRVQLALQGDPANDWLEAKQQLLQEARAKQSLGRRARRALRPERLDPGNGTPSPSPGAD